MARVVTPVTPLGRTCDSECLSLLGLSHVSHVSHLSLFRRAKPARCRASGDMPICVPKEERAMTDTTYVQQLRKTISGEFYFGAMCRETKRRIAISTDTSRGKQRYSQSGETIVSCNHCHKTHRFDNRDIFSFPQVGW